MLRSRIAQVFGVTCLAISLARWMLTSVADPMHVSPKPSILDTSTKTSVTEISIHDGDHVASASANSSTSASATDTSADAGAHTEKLELLAVLAPCKAMLREARSSAHCLKQLKRLDRIDLPGRCKVSSSTNHSFVGAWRGPMSDLTFLWLRSWKLTQTDYKTQFILYFVGPTAQEDLAATLEQTEFIELQAVTGPPIELRVLGEKELDEIAAGRFLEQRFAKDIDLRPMMLGTIESFKDPVINAKFADYFRFLVPLHLTRDSAVTYTDADFIFVRSWKRLFCEMFDTDFAYEWGSLVALNTAVLHWSRRSSLVHCMSKRNTARQFVGDRKKNTFWPLGLIKDAARKPCGKLPGFHVLPCETFDPLWHLQYDGCCGSVGKDESYVAPWYTGNPTTIFTDICFDTNPMPTFVDVKEFMNNGMYGYHTHRIWNCQVGNASWLRAIENYFKQLQLGKR